ncbi:MAG: NAD(P)-binding protein [Patescibacteria group bacterium]|nr:NAD(P)-binding protein [Patescibacteria group bacterium]
MSIKSQKTAIAGAGVIGLYLAWKLSEKGHEITVFEKKKQIGKTACSGLFSERIFDFIPESRNLIENEITSAVLHFPKKSLNIKFSKKFLVMSHFELDRLIALFVEKFKGNIVLNSSMEFLPDNFDRIIGCDGALSSTRKLLKLDEPKFRLGIQVFENKKDFSDFVEVWPTENGFLWKIPRGEQVEYGVIEEINKAKIVFDDFLKKNKIKESNFVSALIPQGLIIPSNNRITLCGDAAGLTKPWSGGGVIWGLIGADILLKNFPDFLKYKKELKRFFLPRINFSKLATKSAYFFGFKAPWALPTNFKIESDFLL